MPLNFKPRCVLLLFLLFAVVAATQTTAHRKMGRTDVPLKAIQKAEFQPPSMGAVSGSLSDAMEFAVAASSEISQLDGNFTPAQWKTLHPSEKSSEAESYYCPSLERSDSLPSGSQTTSKALFYPPLAPSTAVIPALSGQELIDSSCKLALIRVETSVPSQEAAHALAEAVQDELSKRYGNYESKLSGGIHFPGAGSWKEIVRWRSGDVEIISAYFTHSGESSPSAQAITFFVYAQLPIVGVLDHELCCTFKDYHYRSGENQQFHNAVAKSGLNAPLRLRMDQLYEEVYGAYSPKDPGLPLNENWRPALVKVLGEWLKAQSTQPPAQQAAALFAADRLVAAVEDADAHDLDAEKSDLRSELQSLGAAFTTYYPHYRKNWLVRGRELDPGGEVGQMAVLAFISRGNCDPTGWDSEKVISEGVSLLAKGLGEPTESHVHFILGDAYSDIVALAEGADPDIGDDALTHYRNEADTAQTKALAHYRAAFSVDATSETARDAWLQAWHLSAGLLPRTRYVCGDI